MKLTEETYNAIFDCNSEVNDTMITMEEATEIYLKLPNEFKAAGQKLGYDHLIVKKNIRIFIESLNK